MSRLAPHLAGAVAVLAVAACATTPNPSVTSQASLAFEFPVECGPIQDAALCARAVEVAAAAKVNPPPIAEASIRRPRPDDACTTAFHPCAVIVVIQSGDTLQEVPLVRTNDAWVLHDLIR